MDHWGIMKLLKWGGMLLFAGALGLGALTLRPDTTIQLATNIRKNIKCWMY